MKDEKDIGTLETTMIYLSITDYSLEVIQTKKSLISGEKVIASTQKELDEGILVNGLVAQKEKLVSALSDAFNNAYPAPIKDKEVSLIVSDEHIALHRFIIHKPEKKSDLTPLVISKARERIKEDLNTFECFYKLSDLESSSEVLFTAMPQNIIAHFSHVFEPVGLKLKGLSSRSFVLSYLVRPILTPTDVILYGHLEKKHAEYFVIDTKGPLFILQKPKAEKTPSAELTQLISKLKDEHKTSLTKIILAGADTNTLHTQELTEELSLPVVKLNELSETLLKSAGVHVMTSGESKMVYAACIGDLLLNKDTSAANFAKDVKLSASVLPKEVPTSEPNIEKIEKSVELDKKNKAEKVENAKKSEGVEKVVKGEKISEKEQEMKSDKTDAKKKEESVSDQKMQEVTTKDQVPPPMLSEPITQYRKSFMQNLWEKKMIVMIGAVITLLVVAGIVWGESNQNSGVLPFMPKPTETPTPVPPTPTITPTPTIDPILKRSDIKVSVENGTDISGYAKEIGDLLEKKGYKNVGRTNADKDDYPATILKIKEVKKNYAQLIIDDLKEKITNITTDILEASRSSDAVLILGKK